MPIPSEIFQVSAVYFAPRDRGGNVYLTRPKEVEPAGVDTFNGWEHFGKAEGFHLPVDVFIKMYDRSPKLAWLLVEKFHARAIPFSEKWWEGGSGKVDDEDSSHLVAANREIEEEWQLRGVNLTNTLEPSTHPHNLEVPALPAIMQFRRSIGLLKLATIHGFTAWLEPEQVEHLKNLYDVIELPSDPKSLEEAVIKLLEDDALRPFTALLLAYFLTFPETFALVPPTSEEVQTI
jgi:8-oxo-dGTP pyrophosphatase MutT (NUDIX family)